MRSAILIAAFFATWSALPAQKPNARAVPDPSSGGTSFVYQIFTCPVSLRALQGVGGQLVATKNGQTTPQLGQRIHLLAANPPSGKKIAGATVTVEGLSARGRLRPAQGQAGGTSDIQRTMDVSFAAEDEHTMAADLRLAGFTVVNSIELDSITYSDGSIWKMTGKLADHSPCRVTPDGFMLVAGR